MTTGVPKLSPPKVSLIVSTYNWPEALDLCLASASRQTWPDLEILVADDGSRGETRAVVEAWARKSPHPVIHVWHEDQGFRLAKIKNLAAAQATGDYLILSDADCLFFPGFVAGHMRYAEPGWFTAGRRSFLRKGLSAAMLRRRIVLSDWPKPALFPLILFGGGNRAVQLLPLPQSDADRRSRALDPEGAQGCNLGFWAEDYARVGGFDERFEAWGGEDTDLVKRVIACGVRRMTLQHCEPVLHLWHARRKARPLP